MSLLLAHASSCSSIFAHRGEQPAAAEAQPVAEATLSETEAEVLECAIRYEFAQGEFSDGSLFLLTFTDHPERHDRNAWLNPPQAFLQRVVDLRVDFRRPCDVYRNGGDVFRDRATRGEVVLHWVSIAEWIDPNTAEVNVGVWRGQCLGHGGRLRCKKHAGRWQIEPASAGDFWISWGAPSRDYAWIARDTAPSQPAIGAV